VASPSLDISLLQVDPPSGETVHIPVILASLQNYCQNGLTARRLQTPRLFSVPFPSADPQVTDLVRRAAPNPIPLPVSPLFIPAVLLLHWNLVPAFIYDLQLADDCAFSLGVIPRAAWPFCSASVHPYSLIMSTCVPKFVASG